jgi:hypothetical protein
MSDKAAKFLAQWEFQRITVVSRSDCEEQARRLALQCREDAVRAGISSEDLEAAVEGHLFGNMLQALNATEFRQMCRQEGELEADHRAGADLAD